MAETKKATKRNAAPAAESDQQDNGTTQENDQVRTTQGQEVDTENTVTAKPATAKAGKRSAKAQEEADEKQAKEERKQQAADTATDTPKQPVTPTRSRLERRGKKFRAAAEHIDKSKAYSLADALDLAVKTSPVKFDATVELHINLGVNPKHADQNIRDNLVLPAGTGKSVRVAVFDDEKVAEADVVGIDTITKLLEKGDLAFDVLIATPAQMAKLGKYARTLGPRGLMPNPKSGTVTTDTAKAVKDAKAGKLEYRVDTAGIVHVGIGKVSFGKAKLQQNADALLSSVRSNKPASVKGNYVKAIHVTTSMGPSIAIATSEV